MGESNIKCVLLGNWSVGKTSLCFRHSTGEVPQDYIPTLFDNHGESGKERTEMDGKPVSLTYMEVPIAGDRDDVMRLWPLSYMQADVCLMCFSLVDPTSYKDIMNIWNLDVEPPDRLCNYYQHFAYYRIDAPIVLVGTKRDLVNDRECLEKLRENGQCPLSSADGLRLAEEINAVSYMECSSTTGQGVDELFHEVVKTGLKWKRKSYMRYMPPYS